MCSSCNNGNSCKHYHNYKWGAVSIALTMVHFMSKSKPAKKSKVNITIRIDEELANEFRETVRDLAGKPLYLTQSSFLSAAIQDYLKTVRKQLESNDD